MTITVDDLRESVKKMYAALYDLRAETMAAEYTIQELSSQPEDNTALIKKIQGVVDSANKAIQQLEDHIYTTKKAIKIAETGVDSTDVVW